MASLTITISMPALTAGQYFKERHRQLPAGAWSSVTNRTNAAFTLTGLTPGDYQFEFILAKADGTDCQSKYYTYTVAEAQEFECAAFTVTQLANPDKLKIEYTLPSGYAPPSCGYTLGYRIGSTGGFASVRYAALPASPFYVPLSVSGQDLNVRLTADECDAAKICYDDTVPKPPVEPCQDHMSNDGLSMGTPIFLGLQPNGYARFKLRLPFRQSVPPCASITVRINQVGVLKGTPATYYNPAIAIGPADTYVDIVMDFNPSTRLNRKPEWEAVIIDCCDHSLYSNGDIFIPL